jgi:predicted transcriptional regulator
MRVSEVMSTDIRAIREYKSVSDAVLILAESHIHALAVLDQAGVFVGVLSTSDVLEAVAETADASAREDLFSRTVVRELMSTLPRTIGRDADIKDAARQMLYLDVHRLFVTDGAALVGVLAQSDVVRAVATTRI